MRPPWQRLPLRSGQTPDLSSRLEELDRVAVRVFQLDLFSAWTCLDLVSKVESGFLQRLNSRWKIRDVKDHAVPPTRFLMTTIRHRARTRGARAAEQQVEVSKRDAGERWELLMFQFEIEVLDVERRWRKPRP